MSEDDAPMSALPNTPHRIPLPDLEYAPESISDTERARIHANNVMALQATLEGIADTLERHEGLLTLILNELRSRRQ